jgi:glycosyltransferase involved in cell wall biosynthesis
MTKNPTISVVIPAFNTSLYIREAIRSVVDQSLPPTEVIVVDDGSQDDTADIAASFGDPVRVFRQPHLGIAATRNYGVMQAQGDLLAFIDSDDLWELGKLEKQADALQHDTELQGVFALVRQFYTPGLEVSDAQRERLEGSVETGYHAGALLIRREAFDAVGLFDESMAIGEFIDWYARARDLNLKLTTLREVLTLRRIHRTNTGILMADKKPDYAKTMRRILERRKQAASEAKTIRSEETSA